MFRLCVVSILAVGSMVLGQAPRAADPVLATVNGEPVRLSQVDRLIQTRRVPEKMQARMRPLFLDELIDNAVMRKYLAERDAIPTPKEIEAAVDQLRQVAARASSDPDKALQTAGFTEAGLREEVTLPLAWQKHVRRVVTQKSLQAYFQKNRDEFDGTKIHAYHIFIKVDTAQPSPELASAEALLKDVREKIVAGQLTFEDAARQHSHGPSATKGGDIGEFAWHGKMPEAFCRVAFRLKKGEISEPFQSPFGVHICTVVGRTPGQAALEDVREIILTQMSQDLWKKTAAELRAKSKIEVTGSAR